MRKHIRTVETIEMDGGWLCLDYINTIRHRYETPLHDYLSDYEQVVIWFRRKKLITKEEVVGLRNYGQAHAAEAGEAHRKCLEVRETLYQVFLSVIRQTTPAPAVMARLNREVQEAYGHLKITIDARQSVREEWVRLPEQLYYPLYPIVKSAHELLLSELLKRVKECQACGWLFLDKSKNASRRWCNMQTCGSSSKSKRYYDKTRKANNRS